MIFVFSILALTLAVGAGAYLIYSVMQGRPWALEAVRAYGEIPGPAPSRVVSTPACETEIEEETEEQALAA